MTTHFSFHQAPLMALTGWGWVLVFLFAVAVVWLLLWLATRRTPQDTYTPTGHDHADAHDAPPARAAVIAEADDLKKIEGIGPKTEAILHQHGITTFAQLAATETAHIQTILDEAGFRLGDPGTWVEQATLAARGDWQALEALQESLKGGRRVD
ncbi:MAG: hypothetical protein Fur0018_13610 [Anaerolineales bacterium]